MDGSELDVTLSVLSETSVVPVPLLSYCYVLHLDQMSDIGYCYMYVTEEQELGTDTHDFRLVLDRHYFLFRRSNTCISVSHVLVLVDSGDTDTCP